MSWCDDPYKKEREGRDAARYGERYDYEHRERMDNARWDSDSCDAYYARGYEREIERRREERDEEEHREQAHEHTRAEARRAEEAAAEDYYYELQQYAAQPPCEHGVVGPCQQCEEPAQ